MPMIAVDDVIDPETGEVYLDAGKPFTDEKVDKIIAVARSTRCIVIAVPEGPDHPQLARTRTGTERSHEAALLKIYQRLRPGQPAAAGKGQGTVQGEVPRRQPLPARPRRPLPHQPQVRPERARDGDDAPQRSTSSTPIKYLLDLRRRRRAHGRRHRPPRQSPAADDRRTGRRRTAQGLPQAPPHRAGAHGDPRPAGHDAADARSIRRASRRRSSTSSAAANCRRSSTRRTRWRS